MALRVIQVLASVHQKIYSVQKIRLINSKSRKMEIKGSVLIPAIIERWGKTKMSIIIKAFTFGLFSL